MKPIYIATEDKLSTYILEKLIQGTDLEIAVTFGEKGNGFLKKKLPELVGIAPNIPVIMLTDLDSNACASSIQAQWLGTLHKPDNLLFRVAVREVEAWLLADKEGFSGYANIPLNKLPDAPESLPDPKQTLLNLVTRYSPSALKKELVANHGGGPVQGIGYNDLLRQFVFHNWSISRANSRSTSLARAKHRITELAQNI